jgi:hypothetical protein
MKSNKLKKARRIKFINLASFISKMGDELEYKYADPFFKRAVKEFFNDYMMPKERANYIFLGIICFVIVLGLLKFPLGSFVSGNISGLKISIGFPLEFFQFDLSGLTEENPFKILPLAVDLVIYIILSYLLDILISAVSKMFPRLEAADKKAKIIRDRPKREIVEV